MKIVSVTEMRALEAAAFAAGVDEAALQARAARVVADEAAAILSAGQRVAVLVGHGNNGRDGGLAAGLLAERGFGVELFLAPRHALTPTELERLRALNATVVETDVETDDVQRALGGAVLAIDALAGIGTHGALREPLASLAAQLNACRGAVRVLSVDVPSGIDADTGAVPGEAVWADVTVTLGA